jgi:hypothetical protein
MRTTGLRRITNRSIVLPAAAAIIVAACGGEEQTPQSTGTTPVAPAVAVRASSGTTAAVERPDYSQVSYETAESTYRQQRYGESTEMFSAYVERKPDKQWGHYMIGLTSWKGGELDLARDAIER